MSANSAEIKVPALGESIVEATVGQWKKREGDQVAAGEPLVELETDKVNLEVAAPGAGVLQSIARREGETVGIGDVLGVVGAGNGAAAAPPAGEAPAATLATPPNQVAPQPGAPPDVASGEPAVPGLAPPPGTATTPADLPWTSDAGTAPAVPAGQEHEEPLRFTPVARRIAAEHGIDLASAQIQGSGPGGRIQKEDVTAYLDQQRSAGGAAAQAAPAPQAAPAAQAPAAPPAQPAAAPAPASPTAPTAPAQPAAQGRGPEERVRMSRRRQTIARRLVEAQQTAAMLTTFNEIDMSAVMEVRRRRRDAFKERHGIGLGFMSFFTKATVGALKAFPRLNAEIQGDEMVLKKYYDIGIAVGAEEGLVVPVVRDADRLTFAEIERQIAELADKARKGTLSLAELQGGTFTITNGGVFGSLLSTPILNAPQVGILGMHKIEERPIVKGGEVVVRPMMYVALSYDHRIVDGSEAVRFLVRIKELIEDPENLLLEG
jgi:2-oxoglutarate dehydrogenase E2 component (dihydrolipoamide succinyltransferase)